MRLADQLNVHTLCFLRNVPMDVLVRAPEDCQARPLHGGVLQQVLYDSIIDNGFIPQ